MPSCAALLGKAEEEEESSDLSEAATIAPFEMSTLKARAFKQTKKEREEEKWLQDNTLAVEENIKGKRRGSRRLSFIPPTQK